MLNHYFKIPIHPHTSLQQNPVRTQTSISAYLLAREILVQVMGSQSDSRIRQSHLHSTFIYKQLDVLESKAFAVSSEDRFFCLRLLIHTQESEGQAESQWLHHVGRNGHAEYDGDSNPLSSQSNTTLAMTDPLASNICLTLLADTGGASPVQQALRRCWKLNNSVLLRMVIAVTLSSVLVGILVGVFTHSASLGIATTSGFAAILSSIAGILLLRFRRRQ
jgi:hypothetical protein